MCLWYFVGESEGWTHNLLISLTTLYPLLHKSTADIALYEIIFLCLTEGRILMWFNSILKPSWFCFKKIHDLFHHYVNVDL